MPQNNTVQLVETIKKWRNMVPKCSKVRCCTSLQAASSGSNQSARFMAGARPEPWMSVDVNGCQWQNRGCRSSGVVSTDLSKKDPENPVVYHLRSRFRQQRGNFRVSHLIIILSMEIWGQWSRYGLCMHTLRETGMHQSQDSAQSMPLLATWPSLITPTRWGPPVIRWFINPINYIVIGTINHSYWSYKPT